MMTTATMTPADLFAALWPDVRRYSLAIARSFARNTGIDRDDLFSAATMAVWQAARKGTLAASDHPREVALCIAKRAVSAAAVRELPYVQRMHNGGEFFAEAVPAAEVERNEGPTFAALVAFARPADRPLLEWRFRDGETQQEIADRLGIARQRVQQRLDRALSRIRHRSQHILNVRRPQ